MAETHPYDRPALFSLETGRPLLERIGQQLDVPPGEFEEREFEDGEHKIRPLESVRGRDVYLVQSLYGDDDLTVNDRLVRTLTFLGALRDAGAARVTMMAPYLCYARKDMRTKPRDPLTNRYVASLFESVGIDRMVAVDIHNPAAYENAFRIPTLHLTAAPSIGEQLAGEVGDRELVVVSPDTGGVKRAERFRQRFDERLDRPIGRAFVEKFRSGGEVRGGTVVGDVEDRVAVIVDDLVSSGGTLARAAAASLDGGATTAYAAATHGVFSTGATETLGDSELERVVITDTIPPERVASEQLREYLDVVDCAPLLASAIRRLHNEESVVEMTDLMR